MGLPVASVIVPVYNVEPFLRECLDSICGQSWEKLQIILVDDGSVDGSGGICEEYAKRDPRIQVIHQSNRGVSAARNTGLDMAVGKYLYFVDGDDWVEQCLVEETIGPMEAGGWDVCTWGHRLVQPDGSSSYIGRRRVMRFRFPEADARKRFLCRWILPCRLDWSVTCRVFRRKLAQGIRFAPEQHIFEDLDFTFRYLAGCGNFYYLPRALYSYRQRASSAMHTAPLETWAADTLEMVRRQERLLAGQEGFTPFSVYGGTVLTVLLDNFTGDGQAEKGLARAAECFAGTENWEYLIRLAGEVSRGELYRACGARPGERVWGFCRYLLTGEASTYRRADRLEQGYRLLREIKNHLLDGMRR